MRFVFRKLSEICFAHRTSERGIGLLVVLYKHLQRRLARVVHDLVHWVHNALDRVLLAPNCGRDRTRLGTERNGSDLVFARAFDRCHVEAELISSLKCARGMKVGMALEAGDTGTGVLLQLVVVVLVLAQLADRLIA